MQPDPVTVKPNRYSRVFVCIACDLLSTSDRADALTCSGACRARTYRHPERLERLREICKTQRVPVHFVLDCMAIERLRPDLAKRIVNGELEAADVRGEVWRAFWDVVCSKAQEVNDAA